MEYSAAVVTMVFDKFCRLRYLTEHQVGVNQVEVAKAVEAVDVRMDEVNSRLDQTLEAVVMLEGCVGDLEEVIQWQDQLIIQLVEERERIARVIVLHTQLLTNQSARATGLAMRVSALEYRANNPIILSDDETEVGSNDGLVDDAVEGPLAENVELIPIPPPGGQLVEFIDYEGEEFVLGVGRMEEEALAIEQAQADPAPEYEELAGYGDAPEYKD